MTEQVTQTFTLDPQDNERLRSLCGAGDEHLSLIEKYFNLAIAGRGFTFTLQPQGENPSAHVQHIVQSAVDLISVFALLLILQISLYSEPTVAAEPQNPPLRFLFTRFFYFWQQPHISFRWLILLLFVFIPSGMVVSSFIPRLNALGLSSQHIGLLLSVFEPLCAIAFAPLSGLLLKKYSRVSVTQWVLFSQIFAFCLFILFEYVGTDFPYLIAVPILLLSMTYALLVPCLLAIILDYSSKAYATLDSSLQFSVALLGAYLAGFISLRLISTWGYVTVYWIVSIIAFAIWYFFKNYNQKS